MNIKKRIYSTILAWSILSIGTVIITPPCHAFNLKALDLKIYNQVFFRNTKKITHTPWLKKVFNKVFLKKNSSPTSPIGNIIVNVKSGFFAFLEKLKYGFSK